MNICPDVDMICQSQMLYVELNPSSCFVSPEKSYSVLYATKN